MVLVGVGVLGSVLLVLFHSNLSGDDTLGGELVKITYQFCLLGVIGGAGSTFFARIEKDREARRESSRRQAEETRARTEKLRDAKLELANEWRTLLDDLITLYNETKRVRRMLRVKVMNFENPPLIRNANDYDSLLQDLNEVQLSLESHKRRAEADGRLRSRIPELRIELAGLEKYLNEIIREYEDEFQKVKEGHPRSVSLLNNNVRTKDGKMLNEENPYKESELPKLRDFVRRSDPGNDDAPFYVQYSKRFGVVFQQIGDAINEILITGDGELTDTLEAPTRYTSAQKN